MATLLKFSARIIVLNVKSSCKTRCFVPAIHQHARSFCRVNSLMSERKFSDKHEWVEVKGQIATVGISNYAQEALGDVVYAQLPDEDTEFDQDDECGTLESVKAASELYTPVSGKVTEKNAQVEDNPALINKSCYNEGWLFKVELTKMEEIDGLMDEKKYEDFLKEQE